MSITYAITVCNEFIEIQRLVRSLLQMKRVQDNIVVLYDSKNGDPEIEAYLRSISINKEISWQKGEFQGHFADWKNKLTSICTGDYIFQIDADEMIPESLISMLPQILEGNDVDVIRVPRVNTVAGLTQEHIRAWGWKVDERGWVNFPDYQSRLFKNLPHIRYERRLHEKVEGFKSYVFIPPQKDYAIIHEKTIEKQRETNVNYNKLFTEQENKGYTVK